MWRCPSEMCKDDWIRFAEAASENVADEIGHQFLSWDKVVWKYLPGARISGASDKDVALLQRKGGSCTLGFDDTMALSVVQQHYSYTSSSMPTG